MRSPRPPRTSGRVVPHRAKWHQRMGAYLVVLLVRTVSSTLRYQWQDVSGFHKAGPSEAAIYCLWHNRLALSMKFYHGYIKPRKQSAGLAVIVSASKDGAFLASILECFQVQPVRGSSSRRGPQALLELTTWADRGYDLAITPDGPRGPCYRIQEGITSLAQVTGFPIVPVSYHLKWKIRLNSWDRFQVPIPFSKCIVRFGSALRVPRDASDAERENLRLQLEASMNELTTD